MKKIFTSVVFLSILLSACAQSNCSVKKAYAFYTVSIPGMAMSDENGNTINPIPMIDRFIYVEWTGSKAPVIVNVMYDKKIYQASVTAVDTNSVIPGDGSINNEQHRIKSKKCNSLWKIQIQPSADNKTDKQDSKNIVLRFKGTGKTCELKLFKETLLKTLPRY